MYESDADLDARCWVLLYRDPAGDWQRFADIALHPEALFRGADLTTMGKATAYLVVTMAEFNQNGLDIERYF